MFVHSLWNFLAHRRRRHPSGSKDLPPLVQAYQEGFQHLNLEGEMAGMVFVVLDIETTGLKPQQGDRIISLSALRLHNNRIDLSDVFHELVNPARDIPARSAVIHEILPDMVDDKPGIEQVLPRFIEYIGHSVLVGHHGWFDLSFLNLEMIRLYGFPIRNLLLDTARLDAALFSECTSAPDPHQTQRSSTLQDVAERYGVKVEEWHTSFWDAMATAQIFQQMIQKIQQQGVVTLKELLEFVKRRNRQNGMKLNGGL